MQPSRRGLADDAQHRRVVHVGVGNASNEVRRTGAEGAETGCRLASESSVRVGHERGRLLVPAQHELDWAVDERDHEIGVLLAGNAEDMAFALCLEATDKKIGCFHGPPSA